MEDANLVRPLLFVPEQVPQSMLGSWRGRAVYTGVQAASICRGMKQGEVAHLFNQACICVRAYDSASGLMLSY